MPGDWIKVDIDTANKPEVLKLARLLTIPKAHAFGLVVSFWGWCDKNTANGEIVGVSEEDVDILLSQPGFAKALQEVGWMQFDSKVPRIVIPSFEVHNSESAKKRAQKTKRQQKWREGVAPENKERAPKLNGAAHGFDEFYSAYPKHEGRASAEKAWIKLNPDEALRTRISQAIQAQRSCASWKIENGKFIPLPATWLNGKRWEDEAAPKIDLGKCKYCDRQAVSITKGTPHCDTPRHIDHAQGKC